MTRAGYAGPDDDLTIDGRSLPLSRILGVHNLLAQSLTQAAVRPRLDVLYAGHGLPTVPDRFEWAIGYRLDDDQGELGAYIEELRTAGGTHDFCDWKARRYSYRATRSGQSLVYLPRADAYPYALAAGGAIGHTGAEHAAIAWLNGEALVVAYHPEVWSGSEVPEGELWIASGSEIHREAGHPVAAAKLGVPLTASDRLVIEFTPLYRAVVVDVPSQPFEHAGIEEKTLYLAEVA